MIALVDQGLAVNDAEREAITPEFTLAGQIFQSTTLGSVGSVKTSANPLISSPVSKDTQHFVEMCTN